MYNVHTWLLEEASMSSQISIEEHFVKGKECFSFNRSYQELTKIENYHSEMIQRELPVSGTFLAFYEIF